MIEIERGNLLESDSEALVNTVNTVGVMGKGIALQFKQAFPENFQAYAKACKEGDVRIGHMFIFETGGMLNPKLIINFPTKSHWRANSKIKYIELGLENLMKEIEKREIRSITIPPLGCGNGGLDWTIVKPLIEQAFENSPDVHVRLFEPVGTPEAKKMPVRTNKPKMTIARALLIKLMDNYKSLDYRRTLLETQKLAYFLQVSGQNLRLEFKAAHYGPYANNLNKVLEIMEGHFIRGYGDSQKPDAELDLLEEGLSKAEKFLDDHPDAVERLDLVTKLIEGFETPYGLELLATVHWLSKKEGIESEDAILREIRSWNPRKAKLMKPWHVATAHERLIQYQWI